MAKAMSRARLLVLLCLACHPPAPVRPMVPGAVAVSSVSAPPAPVSRFSRIETELSALRGLPFKNGVPSRAYALLGLVPPGFDLTSTLEEALTTQVAAYYDPRSKAFRVVGDTRERDVDEMIVAHELTHALDDQHFDLENFDGGEDNRLGLTEDERTAREFVTEGEATFMMLVWQSASGVGAGKHLGPLAVAGLRMALAMLGAADPLELLAAARLGRSAAELSPQERGELDEMTRLPPLVSMPLIEPYFKGAALVSEVWGRGGWAAVGDLYRHPPASTEQILHAREKFFDRRDPPILVKLPTARPALTEAPVATDVLGELGMRAYFKTWDFPTAEAAAAGWGGDRFWVWKRDGQFTVLWATRWDSEGDAKKFLAAYLDTLEPRFPEVAIERAGPDAWRLLRAKGDLLHIERRVRDVDIIVGARPAQIADLRAVLLAVERRAAAD